uniref:Uncharacterized protein n=1 Tax=Physcomitrium patens TaxID=3218 RepID=A0A2K1L7A3_PHYPA|nr:hypothetical protein PHYPA_000350 [Physcomitrium patens]
MMGIRACEAPFGAWKSPLTAEFVSGSLDCFEGAAVDSDGQWIWLENRSSKSGCAVLVREGAQPGSNPEDITPSGFWRPLSTA